MSFGHEYETSKVGPTTAISFNATGGTVKVVRLKPVGNSAGAKKNVSFAIRAVTGDLRIRQGDSDVTINATDIGMLVSTTLRWRVDVEKDSEAYLAFVGDTATTGNIEITKITDADDYASGETPTVI